MEKYFSHTDDCYADQVDYYGHDIESLVTNNEWECQKACQGNDNCKFWTLVKSIRKCHLKNGKTITDTNNPDVISGPKKCPGMKMFFNILRIERKIIVLFKCR